MHLVFRQAEVHPHRREDHDRGELAVLRADVGAVLLECCPGDPVDRGGDGAVGKVELRRFQLRLGLFHGRGSGLELAGRVPAPRRAALPGLWGRCFGCMYIPAHSPQAWTMASSSTS